jgi:hypothetical protein
VDQSEAKEQEGQQLMSCLFVVFNNDGLMDDVCQIVRDFPHA